MLINKIFNYGKRTIIGLTITGFVYYGVLLGADVISTVVSPEIDSQSRLEEVLEREQEYLNCDRDIQAELVNYYEAVSFRKEGRYGIKIGGFGAKESTVSHESFHICKGHIDDGFNIFDFLFIEEPHTIFYTLTRLRQ